jgi:uncharacterized lipoprotein YehR (DUF1307 family)
MEKRIFLSVFAVLLVVSLAACGSAQTAVPAATEKPAATEAPKAAGAPA